MGIILRKKSMVFVYTAMGVLCVEHANVLNLCYIELLSGDSFPFILFDYASQSVTSLNTGTKNLELHIYEKILKYIFICV